MNRKLKKGLIGGALAAVALTVSACEGDKASDTDLEEPRYDGDVIPAVFESRQPDSVEVLFNVDNHPNLVRICFDGLAFITVSETHQTWTPSYQRIPEWDSVCSGRVVG